MAENQTTFINLCLDRMRRGDVNARGDLIRAASRRLTELTRAMLKSYARLRRWEETDDVIQSALVRLHRALDAVTPETARDFYRLATAQIRRELIDLSRHYFGPEGPARQHESQALVVNPDAPDDQPNDWASQTLEPAQLALWTEFHRRVQELPEEVQEVFDLIWYQGLKQNEAAELLGVSARTVLRRWQEACLKLHDAMKGILPGS
jgi:RNA polymerase sigma-70 factor (ECF subfamily)